MQKKKTIKKIKLATKDVTKKTKSLLKKTNKKAIDIASTLKKQWKKERPQRDKFKRATKKALENSVKIGGDVFETIRNDINEIKRQNKAKK